jgi:hypothetical protein
VQQNYRQSFNDPQIQMAEDMASAIGEGQTPEKLGQKELVDLRNSIAPWIAIYDATYNVVDSNGLLEGKPPKVPQGVLDAAKANAGKDTDQPYENRVTWQPEKGVRHALVVVYVPTKDMYVVAGRNLREVEKREDQLSTYVVIAWLLMVLATGLLEVIPVYVSRR